MQRNTITGEIYRRSGAGSKSSLTIKEALQFDTEARIEEDSSIPNSTGNPTLSDYLDLEAIDDFRPMQV